MILNSFNCSLPTRILLLAGGVYKWWMYYYCKCNTSQLLVHTMGCWCCQKRIGTKLNTKTIPACTCHWPHHFPGSPISLNKIHVNHQIIDINDNFLLTFCVQEILGQRFSVIFHISTSCQSSNKIIWKISKKTQDSVITIVFALSSCLDHIFRHFFRQWS